MSDELSAEYAGRLTHILLPLAERLERYIIECIADMPRVDRISARAKTLDSFMKKAAKVNSDGSPKYRDPLVEIQDIVGVRIIVFYTDDGERAVEIIQKYLHPIEERRVVPESDWEFGYSGRHMVLAVPEDVITDDGDRVRMPEFFELDQRLCFSTLGLRPIMTLATRLQSKR